MSRPSQNLTPSTQRSAYIQYAMAFVSVGGAIFLSLCMYWPLSVETFRSQSVIEAQCAQDCSEQDATEMLVHCLQLEAAPEKIGALINQVSSTTPIRSRALDYRSFETIHKSLQVGVERNTDGSVKFILGYDGFGYEDEQQFLDLLTHRVAIRLADIRGAIGGGKLFQMPHEKLDEAINIAGRLQTDVSRLHNDIDSMSQSRFRLTSATKNSEDKARLTDQLKSMEADSLKSLLIQLKSDSLLDQMKSVVHVSRVSDVTTSAVGSYPGFGATTLILFVSIGLASFITLNVDPFATRGFESIGQIEDSLGVPVVATISDSNESEKPAKGWANRTVDICSTVLLAVLATIIGFILIDPSIREAFLIHPFEGLTRIVRVFMGY